MKNKLNRLFLLGLFLFAPLSTFASVTINEIMYDVQGTDSGREWVEVYNPDSASVDISNYKFLESADASNHGLSVVSGGAVIPTGGYAIIVSDSTKFLTDNPGFSGTILKASFSSLNNTGATISIKSGTTLVDQASYTSSLGASGTGNSLQKTSSGFIPAVPTPGAINATAAVSEGSGGSSGGSGTSTTTTTDTTTATTTSPTATTTTTVTNSNNTEVLSAHSSTQIVTYVMDNPELKADAGRHRITTTDSPIEFEASISGLAGNVSYDWSFGDGTTGSGKIVNHNYLFAGDYVVILNVYNGVNKAVSRTEVKVVNPSVSVINVDRSANGFVELKNAGSYEVNIQNWRIVNGQNELVFPRDTIIKPDSSVKFPFKFTDSSSGLTLSYGEKIVEDSFVSPLISTSTSSYVEPTQEEIEVAKATVARQFALEAEQASSSSTPVLNSETLNIEISDQDATTTKTSSSSIIDNLDTSKRQDDSSLLATPAHFFKFLKNFFTK